MARPTKEQQLLNLIERQSKIVDEKAASVIVDMYDIIEAVARNVKATDASRMAAAKWVIARAEDNLEESEDKDNKPESKEDTEYFSKTYQEPQRKH